MRKLNLIIALLVATTFTTCKKKDSTPPTPATPANGSISGTVYDNFGKTLSQANITTSPATNAIVSDGSGYFKFSNVPPGTYALTVTKNCWTTFNSQIVVASGNQAEATGLVLNSTCAQANLIIKPADNCNGYTSISVNIDGVFVGTTQYGYASVTKLVSVGNHQVHASQNRGGSTYTWDFNSVVTGQGATETLACQ